MSDTTSDTMNHRAAIWEDPLTGLFNLAIVEHDGPIVSEADGAECHTRRITYSGGAEKANAMEEGPTGPLVTLTRSELHAIIRAIGTLPPHVTHEVDVWGQETGTAERSPHWVLSHP